MDPKRRRNLSVGAMAAPKAAAAVFGDECPVRFASSEARIAKTAVIQPAVQAALQSV
jgi:hypothetical protein